MNGDAGLSALLRVFAAHHVANDELVVRVSFSNSSNVAAYIPCLSYLRGEVRGTLAYLGQGLARLRSGVPPSPPRVSEYYPYRNAALPCLAGQTLGVDFHLPLPLSDAANEPRAEIDDRSQVDVKSLIVTTQYVFWPGDPPPAAPLRGFDVYGGALGFIETQLTLATPLPMMVTKPR